MLTTKICLKTLLSNLADGQSRALQGVIKLNPFGHVPRKTFRVIQLCRGLVFVWYKFLCFLARFCLVLESTRMLLLQTLVCELLSSKTETVYRFNRENMS